MKSLWDDVEAARCQGHLAQRVYSSRLLGGEPALVLHGGGNTSVKSAVPDLFGEEEEILYVKGSGWDLATIGERGFAPVRLKAAVRLAELETLSDREMVNQLRCAMTDASAPTPSVEAILHAILPHRFVDHTHADAVVTVTNTPDGEARIREIYGEDLLIIPYVMPGFDLARLAAQTFAAEATPRTIGMVLLNHGIFSFGETAREAYERMIELVTRAEQYLERRGAWSLPPCPDAPPAAGVRLQVTALRRKVSEAAGAPMILNSEHDPAAVAFARRPDVSELAQQGPATPDHVIRTKRVPLVGEDVDAYAAAYREYFAVHSASARQPVTMLDPAPRVILHAEFGLATVGRTAADAGVVRDIYRRTLEIIQRAAALGAYRPVSEADAFAVEYWELEQAKLAKGPKPPVFAGEIALVTGGASGIGRACVESLLERGAAVLALDRSPDVAGMIDRPGYLGVECDVTDTSAVGDALERGARRFGGLDMLVLNAGVFPGSCRIESHTLEDWRRVMSVNLDANLMLLREAFPLLKAAPRGGRVAVIGSKNVPAPGPGAAAYSASKAALTQLARIAALEWGADGIRVNVIHPNAVFDTGIWSEELLQARAVQYGLSVEEYKANNILRVPVTSRDVAELAAEMCGPLFAKITGAQVPLDGGNERVI